ncbi:methylated-DNA--[protein]-cysteine S-methyltransferase [Haliea sp.]|jgi:methylated-DNA-[protein]-cysteine S-methyltransferase|uniref:methylated-DNA--[protein]-cysteine S-methyltransferase n=1 Tax=Haliea sp. TaxID=1932666 RepID=UPI0035288E39
MPTTTARVIGSPLGPLQLVATGSHLSAIHFSDRHRSYAQDNGASAVLERASLQLAEYFAGQRRTFDLPLAAWGTAFQQAVWQTLREIPWGELRSYRDIACALQNPRAVRAVGAANGRNPLPIVVPCHRVIGANGSLTGFAGGLEAKRLLLELEGSLPTHGR